jgi:hypothetical protein
MRNKNMLMMLSPREKSIRLHKEKNSSPMREIFFSDAMNFCVKKSNQMISRSCRGDVERECTKNP